MSGMNRDGDAFPAVCVAVDVMTAVDPKQRPASAFEHFAEVFAANLLHTAIS